MIFLIDIACILFACVAANHLGLVSAIESVTDTKLSVVSCPKCLSFWATMLYGLTHIATTGPIACIAISFLNAWLAVWLELGMAYIDTIYLKLYEKVITTGNDDTPAADANGGDSAGSVS